MAKKSRKLSFRVRRVPGGYQGMVVLPVGVATIPITAKGKTPQQALKRASGLADKLMNSDILQAALPPQARLAVKAVKMLSKHASAGKLAKGLKKITGKGAKRLAKALKFW